MWSILLHSDHIVPLRKDNLRDPQFVCILDPFRMRRYKKFDKLGLNPLRTYVFQRRRQLPDGLRRILFNREIELCRKTHCAQYPQGVFREPLLRLSDTTDQVMVQIIHSPEHIHQAHVIIIRHSVNGKVSPSQIFLKLVCKMHLLRVPAVHIRPVDPVSRHLITVFPQKYSDRTMFDPCINRPSKQFFYLFGSRRCSNIPVLGSSGQD